MGYFGFVIQGWKITHVLFNTSQNNTCNAKQKYNVCKLRLILIVVYTTWLQRSILILFFSPQVFGQFRMILVTYSGLSYSLFFDQDKFRFSDKFHKVNLFFGASWEPAVVFSPAFASVFFKSAFWSSFKQWFACNS